MDPGAADSGASPDTEIRLLADELESACEPEEVSVDTVPGGVSRIRLRFADRETAFNAFDTAESRVRAHPGVVCRVVAAT